MTECKLKSCQMHADGQVLLLQVPRWAACCKITPRLMFNDCSWPPFHELLLCHLTIFSSVLLKQLKPQLSVKNVHRSRCSGGGGGRQQPAERTFTRIVVGFCLHCILCKNNTKLTKIFMQKKIYWECSVGIVGGLCFGQNLYSLLFLSNFFTAF